MKKDMLDDVKRHLDYVNASEQKSIRDIEMQEMYFEIERLQKGYCELKEKCNKGECDCTNEEYNNMCEQNIKLYNEIERLKEEYMILQNASDEVEEEKDREIERLNKEVEKYKKRCYEALTLIRKNYGLLDKYGIDMLDDILNGK